MLSQHLRAPRSQLELRLRPRLIVVRAQWCSTSGRIAQSVERWSNKPLVMGSSPIVTILFLLFSFLLFAAGGPWSLCFFPFLTCYLLPLLGWCFVSVAWLLTGGVGRSNREKKRKKDTSCEVRTHALKRGPELESGALTTRPKMRFRGRGPELPTV